MSLDMMGTVDPTFDSGVDVTLLEPGTGGYTGAGGTWEPGARTQRTLPLVTIQQASMKTAEFLAESGGAVNPADLRVLYLNDGTMLYPDEEGLYAHVLRFTDGRAVRDWRVREADCRPARNYCKIIVERLRE